MRKRHIGIAKPSFFALLAGCIAAQGAVLPSIPEDDPSLPLLERLDGSGGCALPERRPWPGEAVLACLDALDSAALDPVERAQVARLRRRLSLRDSAEAGWGARPAWSSERDGRTDRLFLDLDAAAYGSVLTDSGDATSGIGGIRLRPRVDVLFGDRLLLWSRPFQIVEVSDRKRWAKFTDARTGTYQTALFASAGDTGRARTVDGVEGGIEGEILGMRLRTGVLRTAWGPLPEPLMFSGEASPFPLTEVAARIGPVEAIVLGGRLTGDTFAERRYLYGHRLSWIGRTWSASWSEAAISVGRGLEPLYLVPVFPIIFVEHQIGDPDNRQMDFDASWRPRPDVELSAELFLDDLQNYFGFLSDGWGNKWALGAALRLRDFTGRRTLDRLQVSRIEPWTGGPSSAVLPGDERNPPIHFGKSLGSALGPNSLSCLWDRRQDLSESWTLLSSLRAQWKGEGPGSSVDDLNWRDSSGTWVVAHPTKSWLSGAYHTRARVVLGAERRFLRDQWRATLELGAESSDQGGSRETTPVARWQVAFRG